MACMLWMGRNRFHLREREGIIERYYLYRVKVNPMLSMHRLSFRSKLKITFLMVSVVSILITGLFSYRTTASILEDKALKLTQDTVVKSAQIVDERLNQLMLVMMTFMISDSFQSMLKDASTGNDQAYFTHMTNMDNVFSQARIAEPLIQSIYISTPIGEFYPLPMNRNHSTVFTETQLYQQIIKEKRNIWIEGHEDPIFSGSQRVISLVLQPIAEYPVRDVYVVVNIRENGLRKVVGPTAEGGSLRFLLNAGESLVYDEANPLIQQTAATGLTSSLLESAPSGYTTFKLGGNDYLLNYAGLQINDWTVVAIQSKANVLRELRSVKWTILLITAISFIVTLIISGWFTRYLLIPLQGLLLVMKRVEINDLSARFRSRNEDELAQVGFRFNRMLDQIVLLIEEVKLAEASKRSAEIKSLSAQMDPHFLYNTLNTIYWKLNLKRVEESQEMVMSLSRLFQLGLNKGQEMTTLEKEIQHVVQYLKLQSSCYENLFKYEIRIAEPGLLQQPVPRILLQPLVENSILHGFESMESGGCILIESDVDPLSGTWSLRVSDNGCGMEEDTVKLLCSQSMDQGYAIGNLISRLSLGYGDEARLEVASKPGEGTTVSIVFPWKGENPDEF